MVNIIAMQTHFHRARTHNNDGQHTTAVYVRAVVCTCVCEQTGLSGIKQIAWYDPLSNQYDVRQT